MQSIIVYRNPAEAAFWDMMSSGFMIPIFAAMLVFFICLPIADKLERKLKIPMRNSGYFTLIVSAFFACSTATYLFYQIK